MFNRDTWAEIWVSIKSNPLRTFLSGFSIGWGILMLVVLLGVGNGLKNGFIANFFEGESLNKIFIYPGKTTMPYKGNQINRPIDFYYSDLQWIREDFDEQLEGISGIYGFGGVVEGPSEAGNYNVSGIQPYYTKLQGLDIIDGRNISQSDALSNKKVAIIGKLVHSDLFPKNGRVVGKNLIIRGLVYDIIGEFEFNGNDDDQDRAIYIPLQTALSLYSAEKELSSILIGHNSSMSETEVVQFAEDLEEKIKDKKIINPEDDQAFQVRNYAEGLAEMNGFLGVINIVILVVSIGTLLAGLIGISNVMIVSVKERTNEIGIRKAIGARPKQIIGMIVQESFVITLLSGVIGMLLGIFIITVFGPFIEQGFFDTPEVDSFAILFSLALMVIIGLISGYVPARKAAMIKPIDALRAI